MDPNITSEITFSQHNIMVLTQHGIEECYKIQAWIEFVTMAEMNT